MTTFEEFVRNASATLNRSEWVTAPGGLNLYVRQTFPNPAWIDRYGDIQIANMTCETPGKGALTALLDRWEPELSIYFENVMNHRLAAKLINRDYTKIGSLALDAIPCLIKRRPAQPAAVAEDRPPSRAARH